jgi:hypothetical protein
MKNRGTIETSDQLEDVAHNGKRDKHESSHLKVVSGGGGEIDRNRSHNISQIVEQN